MNEFNLYYTTPTGTHLHSQSFQSFEAAKQTLRNYFSLQNVCELVLKNPFTGETPFEWSLLTGSHRFDECYLQLF